MTTEVRVQSFGDLLDLLFSPKGKYNIVNLAKELETLKVTVFGGTINGEKVEGLVDRVNKLEDKLKVTPDSYDIGKIVSETIDSKFKSVTKGSPQYVGGVAITSPTGFTLSEFLSRLSSGTVNVSRTVEKLIEFSKGKLDDFPDFLRSLAVNVWGWINSAVKYITDTKTWGKEIKVLGWQLTVDGGLSLYQFTYNLLAGFRTLPKQLEILIHSYTRPLETKLQLLESSLKNKMGQLELNNFNQFTQWLQGSLETVWNNLQSRVHDLFDRLLDPFKPILDWGRKVKDLTDTYGICLDNIKCLMNSLYNASKDVLFSYFDEFYNEYIKLYIDKFGSVLGNIKDVLGDISLDFDIIKDTIRGDLIPIKVAWSDIQSKLHRISKYISYIPSIFSSSWKKLSDGRYALDNAWTRNLSPQYNGYIYKTSINLFGLEFPLDIETYKKYHPYKYATITMGAVQQALSDDLTMTFYAIRGILKDVVDIVRGFIHMFIDIFKSVFGNFPVGELKNYFNTELPAISL